MKILGIDIGGMDYCTAYFLDTIPEVPKDYVQSADFAEFKVYYNQEDINAALNLNPDCVVLEPTGGYEDIILHHCQQRNIPYRLANVGRFSAYRINLGIPKADRYDAFALACFGIDKWNDHSAWVHPIELSDLREMLMQRRTLTAQRRSLINQFRQRLHKECPEIQQFNQQRNWRDPEQGLFKWCAEVQFKRFNWWCDRISETCGLGISSFTKDLGRQLYNLDRRALELERCIDNYLQEPEYQPYIETFSQFGFSQQLKAWWLTRCYPFQQFLDEEGKPIEFKRLSKIKQKPVTVRLSMARFKCILGAGTIPNTSGVRGEVKKYYRRRSKGKKEPEYFVVGDRFCRQSFIMWAEKQIVTGRNKAPQANKLIDYYRKKKDSGKIYYKCLGCLHGYTAKLIFKELCRRFSP